MQNPSDGIKRASKGAGNAEDSEEGLCSRESETRGWLPPCCARQPDGEAPSSVCSQQRKGLAVSLAPSPIRRLQHSGSGDPNSLKEKVDLLHQSIKDVNRKVEKAHVVYASIQKLVEDKKPYNPFVQWLWQMGAVALLVFVEHKRG